MILEIPSNLNNSVMLMEKGTLCRGEMQGWCVSVGWIPLVQTKIASEADYGKVGFDVPASRLALWWKV